MPGSRRRFHVVALTRDLSRTLVIETAAGWMLPWFDDDPRAELPDQLASILGRLAASSEMVHEAPLPPEPRQSTAPATSRNEIVHACCVALVGEPILSKDVIAMPNATLLAKRALIGAQRHGWLRAVARLQQPIAAFDAAAQVIAALAWAERQIATRAGAIVLSTIRHRCTRHEYVVRFETSAGTMYFKGGVERSMDEAALTQRLWRIAPHQFPETLAHDPIAYRWLYRELPGTLLLGPRLTIRAAEEAVRALASVQKRVHAQDGAAIEAESVRAILASRSLDARALLARADAIIGHAWERTGDAPDRTNTTNTTDTTDRTHRTDPIDTIDATDTINAINTTDTSSTIDDWHASRDAIASRCATIDRLGLPLGLVLSDFWPRNILATPDGIGFIDLEHSFWSYPFLSLWRFTYEIERLLQTGGDARPRIERAFVDAWADVVSPTTMTRGLAELPLMGRLLGILIASRELDLYEQGLGEPLPSGYRAARLARHVQGVLDTADSSPATRADRRAAAR